MPFNTTFSSSWAANSLETGTATTPLITLGLYRSRLYTANISINPLIAACDPILILNATLKTNEYPPDRNKFLEDLSHEIRAFAQRAQIENYQENIITDARYALCCLLDETIALTADWGKNNGWLQNNLLTIFYNENYGGEYFFTIIDRVLENVPANLDLIELLYLCLSFGFAGKHRQTQHGKNELAIITNKLYQIICRYRHANSRGLFIDTQKTTTQPQQNYNQISTPEITTKKIFASIIIAALVISSLIYFTIHLKLRNSSKPLYPLIKHSINIQNKDEIQP